MKTAMQIQTDFISMIAGTPLAEGVSGEIYRGYSDGSDRPRDSRLEDVVVIFTTANAREIQSGYMTIQIFVPDIDAYGNGVMVSDGQRIAEIESLAQQWCESLPKSTGYLIRQDGAINSFAEEEMHQHMVVVRLRFRLFEN